MSELRKDPSLSEKDFPGGARTIDVAIFYCPAGSDCQENDG